MPPGLEMGRWRLVGLSVFGLRPLLQAVLFSMVR